VTEETNGGAVVGVVATAVVSVVVVACEGGGLEVVVTSTASGRFVTDDEVVELADVTGGGGVVDVDCIVVVEDAVAASPLPSGRALTTRTIRTARSTASPAAAMANRLTAPGYDSAPAFPGSQTAVDQINRPFQLVMGRDEGGDEADHIGVRPTVDDHQLSFEGMLLNRLERFGIGGA